jgi:hypothetical protein
MAEQAVPGEATPWEALSEESRASYGRVARSFLAESQRVAQRNDGMGGDDPLAPLWWLGGTAGDGG